MLFSTKTQFPLWQTPWASVVDRYPTEALNRTILVCNLPKVSYYFCTRHIKSWFGCNEHSVHVPNTFARNNRPQCTGLVLFPATTLQPSLFQDKTTVLVGVQAVETNKGDKNISLLCGLCFSPESLLSDFLNQKHFEQNHKKNPQKHLQKTKSICPVLQEYLQVCADHWWLVCWDDGGNVCLNWVPEEDYFSIVSSSSSRVSLVMLGSVCCTRAALPSRLSSLNLSSRL